MFFADFSRVMQALQTERTTNHHSQVSSLGAGPSLMRIAESPAGVGSKFHFKAFCQHDPLAVCRSVCGDCLLLKSCFCSSRRCLLEVRAEDFFSRLPNTGPPKVVILYFEPLRYDKLKSKVLRLLFAVVGSSVISHPDLLVGSGKSRGPRCLAHSCVLQRLRP